MTAKAKPVLTVEASSVHRVLKACFADQPAAAWAEAKAHRFGFIIWYPAGAQHITGYIYEPWHLRYVGVDAATDIAARGITLEEYLAAAPQ